MLNLFKHQNDVIDVVRMSLLLTLNFIHCSCVSIIGFEQANVY